MGAGSLGPTASRVATPTAAQSGTAGCLSCICSISGRWALKPPTFETSVKRFVLRKLVAPLTGIYSASKAAIEAMTEALRLEVARFGIKVTLLEPGMYKSNWTTTSLDVCGKSRDGSSPYQRSADAALAAFRQMAETRPGSEAVGVAMADMVELEQNPPIRMPVGEDAHRLSLSRSMTPDDAWERTMMTGPFFDGVPNLNDAAAGFAGY